MAEEQNFCTGCGCNLGPGMQFCPQCGKVVEGTDAQEKQNMEYMAMEQMVTESRRNFMILALAIYAIPAIIAGLIAIIDAGNTAAVIFSNTDFQKFYLEHGWHFTQGDLQNYITYIAIMELVSGACVFGSLVCVYKHMKQKIAFVLCLIGAILCIWSIFGALIGILMAWNIYGSNELFDDEPKA